MRGSDRPPIFPSCVLWLVTSTTERRAISSGLNTPNWMPTIDSVSELCDSVGIIWYLYGFLGGGGRGQVWGAQ